MGILMIADAMSSKLVSEQTARVQEFHDRVGILCAEGRCATRLRQAPTVWRELLRGPEKSQRREMGPLRSHPSQMKARMGHP